MAAQILTVEELKTYRDLGGKVDIDKATEAIREAQQVELYDAFGYFSFDIIKNKDEANYADLMNGSEFTISNDLFIHEGIKSLLADYAFARYLAKLKMNLTPFGITIKTNEDSVPVDMKTVDSMILKTLQDADVKKETIDRYLTEKNDSSLFDRYVQGGKRTKSAGSRRYSILNGNRRRTDKRIGYYE